MNGESSTLRGVTGTAAGQSPPACQQSGRDNSARFRIRLKFSRKGPASRLSHLEQIRELRKTAEASGLPCACVKRGKNRTAKISFGPAISVGYESLCEYADIYLRSAVGEAEAGEKIGAAFSPGLEVIRVRRIPLHFPSIESLVNVAEYEIRGKFPEHYGTDALRRFLDRSEIIFVKTKPDGTKETINVRPLVLSMETDGAGTAGLMLRYGPKRNVKPERVLALSLDTEPDPDWKVLKKGLYWESPGGMLKTL
ncbi:MAG: TIGR03936 family radical SAM-associated protein [bacterium]